MSILDEEKECEKFIEKYNLVLTHDEKLLIMLAILHGAMAYNAYNINKLRGDK